MKKRKRFLCILLAVCLLLLGILMMALHAELGLAPAPAPDTGLFQRPLQRNGQGQWESPTTDPEVSEKVFDPSDAEYAIAMPHAAFYSANSRDKAHLLGGDMVHAHGEATEFYLIVEPNQATWVNDVKFKENFPGVDNSTIQKVANTDGVYKITVPVPTTAPYGFNVTVQWTRTDSENPSNTRTDERTMFMHLQPAAGEPIGSIVLGGVRYTARRTENGGIIFSTRKEGAQVETEVSLPEDVTFDPTTYTLNLNGVTLDGTLSFTKEKDVTQPTTLTINVKGTNTINAANSAGLAVEYANLTIQGDGSLNINTEATTPNEGGEMPSLDAPGIRLSGYGPKDYKADLTIKGQVTVNVNTEVVPPDAKNYGHFAPCIGGMFDDGTINVIISDQAQVNLNAHGGDTGIRGVTNITVQGKAQLTSDMITEFDSLTIGGNGKVTINNAHSRMVDTGAKLEITQDASLTENLCSHENHHPQHRE